MSRQCDFWLDLNTDQVVKWPRHLLPGAPPINHIVRCTLEPEHEGDHDFSRDAVEIACDALAPVREMRVSLPPGRVPAEVIDAALKINADVLGVRGACCDGVPEAVAYAYGCGLADGAAHAVAEAATSRLSCFCQCHKPVRFWAEWCNDCEPRHVNDLSEVARTELIQLWTDMVWALREADNGSWSIRAENLAYRIVLLSRLVGVAPWTVVETSLLRKEVYQKVHNDAGLEFPPIDWERVAEVERKIR